MLVHDTWIHTKSLDHLVKGQHPFVKETIKARFKSMGGADLGDNGDSELKPIGGRVALSLATFASYSAQVM